MYGMAFSLKESQIRKPLFDLLFLHGFNMFLFDKRTGKLTVLNDLAENMIFLDADLYCIYNGRDPISQEVIDRIEKEGVAYKIEKRI